MRKLASLYLLIAIGCAPALRSVAPSARAPMAKTDAEEPTPESTTAPPDAIRLAAAELAAMRIRSVRVEQQVRSELAAITALLTTLGAGAPTASQRETLERHLHTLTSAFERLHAARLEAGELGIRVESAAAELAVLAEADGRASEPVARAARQAELAIHALDDGVAALVDDARNRALAALGRAQPMSLGSPDRFAVGRVATHAGGSFAASVDGRSRGELDFSLTYRVDRHFDLTLTGALGHLVYERTVPDASVDRDSFLATTFGGVDLSLAYRWGSDEVQLGAFVRPGFVGNENLAALRLAVGLDFRFVLPVHRYAAFEVIARPFAEAWFPTAPNDDVSVMFGGLASIGFSYATLDEPGPDGSALERAEALVRSDFLRDATLERAIEGSAVWTSEWRNLDDELRGDSLGPGECRAWFALGPSGRDVDLRAWLDVTAARPSAASTTAVEWEASGATMIDDAADELPIAMVCNPADEATPVHIQGRAYDARSPTTVRIVRFRDRPAPRYEGIAEVGACPSAGLDAGACCITHVSSSADGDAQRIALAAGAVTVHARALRVADATAQAAEGAPLELRWSRWTSFPARAAAAPAGATTFTVDADVIGTPVVVCATRPDPVSVSPDLQGE